MTPVYCIVYGELPSAVNLFDKARLIWLYTHSINGGALGKPGPNSARTRLVSPLARRKIKYAHIYKFCKANGGRHSGCIPGGEVALAAKNWRVKILASMSRWFLQRTQNKGRIREKVGVLLIRADCVQFSKRKLTPWRFFPSHKLNARNQ